MAVAGGEGARGRSRV
uniref:Uncharacterized protein n=1 Tax=Arundo donax TaxID=35708 RepID=A0A0A9BVQ3_ARUDO